MAQDNSNHFILNRLYPEVKSILNRNESSIEEIGKEAIFIMDTNSLLMPFKAGKKGIEDIKRIYKKLIKEERLFIPAHVLREFARNRANRISDLFSNIDRHLSDLPSVKSMEYPILGELEAYKKLQKIRSDINDKLKDYKSQLTELKTGIADWNWHDPVTIMYSNAFSEVIIIEVNGSEEELINEYETRLKNSIPPGNKDKGKGENEIGDFLIWKVILDLGKSKGKDVIFVTNDEKNDWMVKGNSQSISTRFELVDEFNRHTSGRNFACITFEDFLESQGLNIEFKETIPITSATFAISTSFGSLKHIRTIIKEFIDSISTKDEQTYISRIELDYHLSNFLNSSPNEFLNDIKDVLGFTLVHYTKFKDLLSEIRTLNSFIEYEEHRMKRDTSSERSRLILLAKMFLKEYNSFRKAI